MSKIIIPNAIERKPKYLYYIDGEGNICEARSYRTRIWNMTFKEIFQCFWIDVRRSLQKNQLIIYKYVCPICNYDFKDKEDAVNCCSGENE